MAEHRPAFARMSTEQRDPNDIELQERKSDIDNKSRGEHELNDRDVKDGTFTDIKTNDSDDTPPGYEDAGDGCAKVTGPVSSAKSLTTQVLHVEDDPTLSPYTFRVFFLGEYGSNDSPPCLSRRSCVHWPN